MSKLPVFDIGDTLIPVTDNINEPIDEELGKIGVEDPPYFPMDQFNIYDVDEIQDWLVKHGIDADAGKIHEAYIGWKRDYFKKSDVLEDIKKISEEFGPIGIITDNPIRAKKCYREIFEEHGLDIRGFIASGEIGAKKPEPEIFQAFVEKRDEEAGEIVYFGNDLRRDNGAMDLGMKFVLVSEHRTYGSGNYDSEIKNLNYSTIRKEL